MSDVVSYITFALFAASVRALAVLDAALLIDCLAGEFSFSNL